MKQFEAKSKQIGENVFYIRPFPALVAANLSGDLAAVLTPLLSSIVPLALQNGGNKEKALFDMNIDEVTPALTNAAAALSGDKIEYLMKKLLINHRNVSVVEAGSDKAELLTEDLLNEIFCGDISELFLLAAEVIRINFDGFFRKLGSQFGAALGKTMGRPSMSNSASLT